MAKASDNAAFRGGGLVKPDSLRFDKAGRASPSLFTWYTSKHMQNETQPTQSTNQPAKAPASIQPASNKKSFFTAKSIGLIVTGIVLFVFGVLVGQGTIRLTGTTQFSSTNSLSAKPDYGQLDELYTALRQSYNGNLTNQQVMDGLKHGMAESTGDPYTEFMTAKEAEDFSGSLQGTISGIGAKLELDDEKNVVIAAPLAGSPAEAAGLRAKDVVVSVDGKPAYGLSVNEAVKKIRGEKGTEVKLTIIRGKAEQFDVTIVRDTIKIPSVVTKKLSDNQIGYIQVSQFSDDTDELVQKAAATLKDEGVKKIILDLRDNPGGEVTTAVNLSSLWLSQGDQIVQQRRGATVVDTQNATGVNTLKGIPTVVLLNAGSASASEITALALRDHGAATIIGEQSYGKGVVQQLMPFKDGSSLKVTIAKWYSPKGTNIDKKGIKPDVEVKMTDEAYKNNTDLQLDAATDFLLRQ